MKEVIKIAIALAIILVAYKIGNHQQDEVLQLKIEKLNHEISFDKKNILLLQDSIHKLQQVIDLLKSKPIGIVTPIKEHKGICRRGLQNRK